MKKSWLSLPVLLAGLSGPAYSQSMPDWKSYMQTHDLKDIVSSLEVAAWLGKKLDVSQKNAPNGVAPLDSNGLMSAGVSGSLADGIVAGANPRTFSERQKDIPDLNDYVSAWDGSPTFRSSLEEYFNSGHHYAAPLPCNSAMPLTDKNGYADIGNITGKMFIDLCGVQRVGGGFYNYVDYALGNNNPTITSYAGSVFFNRYNSGDVNSVGHVFFNLTQATSNPVNQWPGGSDPDMPNVIIKSRLKEYGPDGITPTTGSPLAFTAETDNYSHRSWAVQAQGEKIFCTNHRVGGSCWGYSTNINDVSGRSAQAWNLINENDSQSNGPENPAAFYNPKASYRQMDYASAIAVVPAGWAANTAYSADGDDPDKIGVMDGGGVQRILIAATSGKTGATFPTIPANPIEGSTIPDGTMKWTVGTQLNTTIGVVHWINRDQEGSASSHASYNFGFSGNALMNNSMFDASHSRMGPKAAAFRMASDQRLSVCDDPNATDDSGINRCYWTHDSVHKEWAYNIGGTPVITMTDTGAINATNTITGGVVNSVYDMHAGGNMYVGSTIMLTPQTETEIKSISKPVSGQIAQDGDAQCLVVYENGHWNKIRLGDQL